MYKRICTGKIHRATVTEANLNYEGSISVDETLIKAAGMVPYEMVQITNLRNGAIWQTYLIPTPPGSGSICLNGPPAHHFQPGDLVIIISYGFFDTAEMVSLKPKIIFVDEKNSIKRVAEKEIPFSEYTG